MESCMAKKLSNLISKMIKSYCKESDSDSSILGREVVFSELTCFVWQETKVSIVMARKIEAFIFTWFWLYTYKVSKMKAIRNKKSSGKTRALYDIITFCNFQLVG